MVIQVRVKPRSRTSRLERTDDGAYTAHLKSPPVDGKANAELIALLAEHFSAPKSAISIKSGASARLKLVKINES
ncbi:DUF167 domain-containing protein [soil metagenome]